MGDQGERRQRSSNLLRQRSKGALGSSGPIQAFAETASSGDAVTQRQNFVEATSSPDHLEDVRQTGKLQKSHSKFNLTFEESQTCRVNFRRLILRKYGTVVKAWKAIDSSQDGKLSWNEFMRASREIGIVESARKIFIALDQSKSGVISIADVDPPLAETLCTLAISIWSIFGNVERAWKYCFNRSGKLRVGADEFVKACMDIQYPGDSSLAFSELCTDKASNGMSRQEFGFLHFWISNGQPDQPGSEDPESRWAAPMQHWEPPPKPPVSGELRKNFKELLLKSYTNFVRAWREGLDRDHNGVLDFKEFTRAVKDVGFAGNPRELWEELDINGNGVVSLWELDLPTAKMLKEFGECAEARHGSWQRAWDEVMDTRLDDRVKSVDFKEGCRMIGYQGDADKLFDLLDTDKTRYLTWDTTAWITGIETADDEEAMDVGPMGMSGTFTKLTRNQRRRADINARAHRARVKYFEGRARGEIPGSNPAAGTTIFSPGVVLNSHIMGNSSPSLLFSQQAPSQSFTGYRHPVEEPNYPDWLLVAEGRARSPESKPKYDLSFPLKPQQPGKGGWPGSKLKLQDELWGGSKDLGKLVKPMTAKAVLERDLARWRKYDEKMQVGVDKK
eukprot:CAMPEP_0197635030 /NCGR_PEP_ID=MMETSP1338-20131121/10956_1 /TAXON_ID=43686 ORGANISM="Pelagodinium beii, Strain RCC1491" /NCGR_SAMPLE_ID=MMETSP1338 /ASSEMBLY_ACC=CAM_ASM_000754 /LENGTH=617 /DNA_ID=CAMNT_0043207005 /DNA_START=32 /DNA_END=1885 /DNA_ORIENTATION=-